MSSVSVAVSVPSDQAKYAPAYRSITSTVSIRQDALSGAILLLLTHKFHTVLTKAYSMAIAIITFMNLIMSFPLPVYANYADTKLYLMQNYYPDLVFRSIVEVHFTNKKDGPCRCAKHPHDPTRTLYRQRRAEIVSMRPIAIRVGLFCCLEYGGDI